MASRFYFLRIDSSDMMPLDGETLAEATVSLVRWRDRDNDLMKDKKYRHKTDEIWEVADVHMVDLEPAWAVLDAERSDASKTKAARAEAKREAKERAEWERLRAKYGAGDASAGPREVERGADSNPMHAFGHGRGD